MAATHEAMISEGSFGTGNGNNTVFGKGAIHQAAQIGIEFNLANQF